jgi:hypothetical protein
VQFKERVVTDFDNSADDAARDGQINFRVHAATVVARHIAPRIIADRFPSTIDERLTERRSIDLAVNYARKIVPAALGRARAPDAAFDR